MGYEGRDVSPSTIAALKALLVPSYTIPTLKVSRRVYRFIKVGINMDAVPDPKSYGFSKPSFMVAVGGAAAVPVIGAAAVPVIGAAAVPVIGAAAVPVVRAGAVPVIGAGAVPVIGGGFVGGSSRRRGSRRRGSSSTVKYITWVNARNRLNLGRHVTEFYTWYIRRSGSWFDYDDDRAKVQEYMLEMYIKKHMPWKSRRSSGSMTAGLPSM